MHWPNYYRGYICWHFKRNGPSKNWPKVTGWVSGSPLILSLIKYVSLLDKGVVTLSVARWSHYVCKFWLQGSLEPSVRRMLQCCNTLLPKKQMNKHRWTPLIMSGSTFFVFVAPVELPSIISEITKAHNVPSPAAHSSTCVGRLSFVIFDLGGFKRKREDEKFGNNAMKFTSLKRRESRPVYLSNLQVMPAIIQSADWNVKLLQDRFMRSYLYSWNSCSMIHNNRQEVLNIFGMVETLKWIVW